MITDASCPPDPRVEGEIASLQADGHELRVLVFSRTIHENTRLFRYRRLGWLSYKLSALAYTLPFYHLWVIRQSHKAIRDFQPDVLHAHDLRIARAVDALAHRYQLPWILDLHENRPEIMMAYPFMQSPLSKLLIRKKRWQLFEKRLIQSADATLVVTPEARDWYIARYQLKGQNFCVVPNAVDASFVERALRHIPNQDRSKSTGVLYIGDTGSRRGIAHLLEAMSVLKQRNANLHLTLLGTSRDDSHWKALIRQLDLEDRVFMPGWVSYEEIHAALAAHHIGVCPILRNAHHDTTYANKLFQTMAYALPLVVSDCPAQAALVSKYASGVVYEAGNATALAEAFEKLHHHPKEALTLGQNGRSAILTMQEEDFAHDALRKLYAEDFKPPTSKGNSK